MWIVAALATPLLHGFANILDNYFVSDIFKRVTTFAFFSALCNFLFLPIIFIIATPHFPSITILPFYILLGVIDVLYLIPYYKALQNADTSIVTSLFSLGQIFVPILAYLIVSERLAMMQYMGFVLIIISSALLGIERGARFRFNKAVLYMLGASLLLALETAIYKYVLDNTHADWSTAIVWPTVFTFLIASILLLFQKTRVDIKGNIKTFKMKLPLFVFEEFLTFSGSSTAKVAIALAPAVTLVEGISSIQPVFVMLYAVLLSRMFPRLFKEKIDKKSIIKKLSLFILIGVGVYLTLA